MTRLFRFFSALCSSVQYLSFGMHRFRVQQACHDAKTPERLHIMIRRFSNRIVLCHCNLRNGVIGWICIFVASCRKCVRVALRPMKMRNGRSCITVHILVQRNYIIFGMHATHGDYLIVLLLMLMVMATVVQEYPLSRLILLLILLLIAPIL